MAVPGAESQQFVGERRDHGDEGEAARADHLLHAGGDAGGLADRPHDERHRAPRDLRRRNVHHGRERLAADVRIVPHVADDADYHR